MNEDQTSAAQALLRELWQGNESDIPRIAAYDPQPVCAGCRRPLSPDVLARQTMATYCHYCRSGSTEEWI